ncbi:MAG: LacI family DNA-binding transcriptional regulator [Bacillota bacterium]
MPITMKDVAKHSGISLGTVSNHINGKVNVSKSKQIAIDKSIKELGYQVNVAARNLKSSSYRSVGVVIPDFGNVYILKLVRHIEEFLRKYGYDMVVVSYQNDSKKEKEVIQELMQRVDAITIVPSFARKTEEDTTFFQSVSDKMPLLLFNESINDVTCDRVLVDNEQIVKKSIQILFDKGHRNIAIIAGPEGTYTAERRLLGYHTALAEKGIEIKKELIFNCNYSKTMSSEVCENILENHKEVTAIFVVGYKMTLGVLSAISKNKMGDQIAVIGYDCSDIENITTTPLTYVYQPYQEVARNVVEIIMKRVREAKDKKVEYFPIGLNLEAHIRNVEALPEV